MWKLRPEDFLDEGEVSYLQDQTAAVVCHRRGSFYPRLLRKFDVAGEFSCARLSPQNPPTKKNEGGEPRPKGLAAFSRVVLQNWEV